MDRAAELRLPTVVVPVGLCLIGQEPRDAELFVADVLVNRRQIAAVAELDPPREPG